MTRTLNQDEIITLLEKMDSFKEKVSESEQSALDFLVRTGIRQKNGDLTENYK